MSLYIRRYQSDDLNQVWHLHNVALEQTGAHFGNGVWDDDLKDIESVYLKSKGEFVVGLVEDRIIAMGALRYVSDVRAEIKRMRVDPHFQRQGFGQLILDYLEKRAAEFGYQVLCLDTTSIQIGAQRLYIKNGYREVRREQKDGSFELIFYQKKLASG